jgi:hypothetical protein
MPTGDRDRRQTSEKVSTSSTVPFDAAFGVLRCSSPIENVSAPVIHLVFHASLFPFVFLALP